MTGKSSKALCAAVLAVLAAASFGSRIAEARDAGPDGAAPTAVECPDEDPAVFPRCDGLEGAELETCLFHPDERLASECAMPAPLSCGR